MKKYFVLVCIALLIFTSGCSLVVNNDVNNKNAEYSLDTLLEAIKKTENLESGEIKTVSTFSDKEESGEVIIKTLFNKNGDEIDFIEENKTEDLDTGKITKNFTKTINGETWVKFQQDDEENIEWCKMNEIYKSSSGLSCLNFNSLYLEEMNLVDIKKDGDLVKYTVFISDKFQKRMDEMHPNESYKVLKFESTYWVNSEGIIVKSMMNQHVIYDSVYGYLDVTTGFTAELLSYNQKVDLEF